MPDVNASEHVIYFPKSTPRATIELVLQPSLQEKEGLPESVQELPDYVEPENAIGWSGVRQLISMVRFLRRTLVDIVEPSKSEICVILFRLRGYCQVFVDKHFTQK